MLLRIPHHTLPFQRFVGLRCSRTLPSRFMATSIPASPAHSSHAAKTAGDPRSDDTHTALISSITAATSSVRLIDFQTKDKAPFTFKAGQWVDLFTPETPDSPGGFSIVSAPATGLERGTFTLAIQHAPRNPSATYLWRPVPDLIESEVRVRVGGQFTFPPVNFRKLGGRVRRVVCIAGGIGSNPMLSILRAIRDSGASARLETCMIYGIKSAESAIFIDDLHDLQSSINLDLRLFVSQSAETQGLPGTVHQRRFEFRDLDDVIGQQNDKDGDNDEQDKSGNLYYICGPAQMTDFVQEYLISKGVPQEFVQTERWW